MRFSLGINRLHSRIASGVQASSSSAVLRRDGAVLRAAENESGDTGSEKRGAADTPPAFQPPISTNAASAPTATKPGVSRRSGDEPSTLSTGARSAVPPPGTG